MRKSILISFLVILWSSGAYAIPVLWSVSDGGNDHWYELVDSPNTSWTDAVSTANAMGGHLATITSAQENSFIFNLGVGSSPFWLGATDGAVEGTWEWITGEDWLYSNWAAGEPNNLNNEDSLAFAFFTADGRWNDAPTDYTRYANGGFVVEYNNNPAPVPEPGTMLLLGIGLLGFARINRKQKNK